MSNTTSSGTFDLDVEHSVGLLPVFGPKETTTFISGHREAGPRAPARQAAPARVS
jgi:hypothetical protein